MLARGVVTAGSVTGRQAGPGDVLVSRMQHLRLLVQERFLVLCLQQASCIVLALEVVTLTLRILRKTFSLHLLGMTTR